MEQKALRKEWTEERVCLRREPTVKYLRRENMFDHLGLKGIRNAKAKAN